MDLKEVNDAGDARHPWELTRFEFFEDVLRRHDLLSPTTEILDIGSGDAWFSGRLASRHALPPITCWDQRYTDASAGNLGVAPDRLRLCSERPSGRYDLILMLDVLEHVEDDKEFLRETVAQNLRPGGRVLISVPAWEHLQSDHDRWLEHYRRYVPGQFRDTLRYADLEPLKKGGLFHSLLLPRTLGVFKERLLNAPPLDEEPTLQWQAGPWFTKLVTSALRADNTVSRWASEFGLPLPGLSLWALCQQPSQ